MYQSNRNLLKKTRNCFYDVHKWQGMMWRWTSSFDHLISDLRNAPKWLRKSVRNQNKFKINKFFFLYQIIYFSGSQLLGQGPQKTSKGPQSDLKWFKIRPDVTLDHKTSLKSLGHICSNSQKYIVWVKMINFNFMPKIIRFHEDIL